MIFNRSVTDLWIRSYGEIVGAKMTLHPEFVKGCRVIHANFLLLGIVPNAHANMIVAAQTPNIKGHLESKSKLYRRRSPEISNLIVRIPSLILLARSRSA